VNPEGEKGKGCGREDLQKKEGFKPRVKE